MNIIDELERLDGLATEGPWQHMPVFGAPDRMQTDEECMNEELCKFIGTHRKTIIRMLRAANNLHAAAGNIPDRPSMTHHLRTPNWEPLRKAYDEYQAAKESI